MSTKMTFDSYASDITLQPASDYDVRLILSSLALPDSQTNTRAAWERLAREDPRRAEPWVRLAYLAVQDRDLKTALDDFSKAYALGDHSPELLWDYGRYAERERPEDSVRALGELLKLEPDNLDARIGLASAQTTARHPREALATLSPIKQIDAEHGQPLFYTMARAQVLLGETGEARASALRLQSVALTQDYRDRAAEILTYLDEQERLAQAKSGRQPAAPKTAGTQAITLYEVQGRIVEMLCGQVPSVVVETSQGRLTFSLEPNRYAVTGKVPSGNGMRCGPQEAPPAVRVLYEVLPADARGDGAARELRFE